SVRWVKPRVTMIDVSCCAPSSDHSTTSAAPSPASTRVTFGTSRGTGAVSGAESEPQPERTSPAASNMGARRRIFTWPSLPSPGPWPRTGDMGDDGRVTKSRTPGSATNSPPGPAPSRRWSALRPKRGLLAATVLIVAAIDQASKVFAVDALDGRAPVDLIGEWFQLTLLRNPGAAFSMGTGSTWLFTTIQIAFI